MALTALALVKVRDLFAVVMLSGIFSLTAAALYVVQDAVDVAFTEASVGAGIATVLGLATLAVTRVEVEKPSKTVAWGPLLLVVITGAALIYGTLDMPGYGDPDAPIHQHVAPALPGGLAARDRRAQRRHLGAGQLPRLRHARRDDGGAHRGRAACSCSSAAAGGAGASRPTEDAAP